MSILPTATGFKRSRKFSLVYWAALSTLLWTFPSGQLLACPGCAGSMDNPKNVYTVFVLAGFIALTAIPFYFIYSMIYKNRNINKKND